MTNPQMRHSLFLITALLISSCTVNGVSDATRNVVPDTQDPQEDILNLSSDPQEALNQIADLDGAVDQSRISDGPCGRFALTVGPLGLRSYVWDSGSWSRLRGEFENVFLEPYLITTRDYNYDGVNEFLVNFDQNGDGSQGSMFGAILSPDDCSWDWVWFSSPNGETRTVRNLFWTDETDELFGSIVYENQEYPAMVGYGTDGIWYAEFLIE